ncbi:uncharacterized protein BXZ73DRAFT_102760 [Epithele typhae]|uniref:uncharacterized protein n=1 Tax=Epithele typhae TaxID=378194 RepID=UPI0020075014|nr:uncharacterized protein BXZ73DRAFT_102760 [Epithele typhae]KAH9927172.1 hypothetical protein BXZ73DRAFT_102760 [Epithele typhae]
MRSAVALLAFAASAFAYQVSQPSNSSGWSTAGSNVVAWDMVSTDAANFTVLLVNQEVNPPTSQVLAALVDGSLGKTTVNPPSGGWKAGTGFQVNLVKDTNSLTSIYAQSGVFTIAAASTTQSLASTASSGTVLTVSGTTTKSSGSDLNPSASQTSTSPTKSNGASKTGAQAGLFAGLALLGAMLA